MTPRIIFYVQHLLGIGHLRRAAVLARALAEGGFDVLMVSGGAPIALDLGPARLHQLPPVRARDETLRELVRLDGAPVDHAFRAARAQELVSLLHAEAPSIVITEQFPFGRTQLRFELVPLVEAARALRPRPSIVCSVRDVVRRSVSSQRVAETLEMLAEFDLVLVHADPRIADFGKSFAAWDRIAARAVYTGYVAPPAHGVNASDAGTNEVVVSIGGGAVGAPLLEAALAARRRGTLADRRWRLLVGANLSAIDRAALKPQDGVVIEPSRRDFPTLLANAALSISQAGYNTVVDILRFADRALLVPFSTERETEQSDRARLLAARGMATVVPAASLSAESLAAGIEQALAGPSLRSFPPCDVGGAAATVELLRTKVA
ncbi:glycosyltransferase [Enhydrobacter sp.]|jgi:predicted glycosyltransferase|uniref:glycosyltransferase family protein n=1 Tax=Enhydrobacter sp. TaxID=1894999 RepID=UPI00261F7A21|nr:glycosyltransferase [Enhydrobacter sp.]WIM11045.1 MAG: glycosyl transferase [Enhydrobacter sp.]